MKLSVKIALTLLALSCCITLMGWFSLVQMKNLNRMYQDVSQNWFPSSVIIQRLNTLTSEFRRFEISHIYTSSSHEMNEREESIQNLLTNIQKCVNEYRAVITIPEEQQNFQALESLWEQYMEIHAQIMKLSRENNTEKAVELLEGKSKDIFDAFSNVLSANVDLDVEMGKLSTINGECMYDDTRRLILYMMVALLLLTALVAVYLIRDMLRKLGKDPDELGALARRVAGGDPDVPTDSNAVGVYADILVMMEKLRQHIESVETITSNLPGGVQSCLQDAACTITYASTGLLDMFGYSREEIANLFDNSYLKLIFPEDSSRLQQLQQKLKCDDTYETEYRILHKDGHEIWVLDRGRCVLDKGEMPLLCCVLIDITELVRARRQLKRQEEQGLAALCATNDFVYEADRDDGFLMHKGGDEWIKIFGQIDEQYSEAYEHAASLCHPDDEAAFRKAFSPAYIAHEVESGTELIQLEYRLRCISTGQYQWFSNSLVPFTGADSSFTKVFVCIKDITDRKQHEHSILSTAQRDSLTGLFNKGHVEKEITMYLEGEGTSGRHALLIADIDDFKAVNDSLGHLYGDAVITSLGSELKKVFRGTDILGRIGGDEFIILIKDVASDELICTKAVATCEAFQKTIAGDGCEYTISGSVGIALYPEHGSSYRELFRKMDAALYEAKQAGKNRFCIYNQTTENALRNQSLISRPTLTNIVSRSEETSFENNLLSYIFELLYEAKDTGTIINIIIEMIGKHYDVSRAYVFQNCGDDDSCCRNTYEWCNEGISPQKDHLQCLKYADLNDYLDGFTQDGVYYCEDISRLTGAAHDILAAQGIRSMLHLAIFDAGKFKGFVGFDECSGNRLWTKKEIHTLGLVAKILGIFLLKNDMSRQLIASYTNIQTILDNLDIWAYVIDKDNYELLYVNAKTQKLSLASTVGTPCHYAFFGGRTEPCLNCPRALLQDTIQQGMLEVYNDTLDLWVLATASPITWSDGRTAILICSIDISNYKTPPVKEPCTPVQTSDTDAALCAAPDVNQAGDSWPLSNHF